MQRMMAQKDQEPCRGRRLSPEFHRRSGRRDGGRDAGQVFGDAKPVAQAFVDLVLPQAGPADEEPDRMVLVEIDRNVSRTLAVGPPTDAHHVA